MAKTRVCAAWQLQVQVNESPEACNAILWQFIAIPRASTQHTRTSDHASTEYRDMIPSCVDMGSAERIGVYDDGVCRKAAAASRR